MCILSKTKVQNKAIIAIVIGLLLTGIFCLFLLCRYWNHIPLTCQASIDANLTASIGSLLGGILAPLWSIIAVFIYFSALVIQANELKNGQNGIFAQNLNTLISRAIENKEKITIKSRRTIYKGDDGFEFLYVCLKYCFRILNKETITPIESWEKYDELKQYEQSIITIENIQLEEYLKEITARNNYDLYKEEVKREKDEMYIPYFICLLQLSNSSLQCVKDPQTRIVDSVNIVLDKYKGRLNSYCIAVELCIDYIFKNQSSDNEKKQYAIWINAMMQPSELAFFYYYLYSRKDEKQLIINYCKELDFFRRIKTEGFLFDDSHYNLYS